MNRFDGSNIFKTVRSLLRFAYGIFIPLLVIGIAALVISTAGTYWRIVVDFLLNEFLKEPLAYLWIVSEWCLRVGIIGLMTVMVLRLLVNLLEWIFQRFFVFKTGG